MEKQNIERERKAKDLERIRREEKKRRVENKRKRGKDMNMGGF